MATETAKQSSDDDKFSSDWLLVSKCTHIDLDNEDSDEDSIEVIEREVLISITPTSSSDNEEEEKCLEMIINDPQSTESTLNTEQNLVEDDEDDLSNTESFFEFTIDLNFVKEVILLAVIWLALAMLFIRPCMDHRGYCLLGRGSDYDEIMIKVVNYVGIRLGYYEDDYTREVPRKYLVNDYDDYLENKDDDAIISQYFEKEDKKLPVEEDKKLPVDSYILEYIKQRLSDEQNAFDSMREQYEKNLAFLNNYRPYGYTLNINAWESSVPKFGGALLASLKERMPNNLCPNGLSSPLTICLKNGIYLLYMEEIHLADIFFCVSEHYKDAKKCSTDQNIRDLILSILSKNNGSQGNEFSNKKTEEIDSVVHDAEYLPYDDIPYNDIPYNEETFEERNYEEQYTNNMGNSMPHPHTQLPENNDIPLSNEHIVPSEKHLENIDVFSSPGKDFLIIDKIDTKATFLMESDIKSFMEYDKLFSTRSKTRKETDSPEIVKDNSEKVPNQFPEDYKNPNTKENIEQLKDVRKETNLFDSVVNDELFSKATAFYSENLDDDASNLKQNSESIRVDSSQTFNRYHDTMIKIENLTAEIKSLIKEFRIDLKQFYKNQIVDGKKKKKRDLRRQRIFERAVIQQYLHSGSFDREIDLLNFTSFDGPFPDQVHGFAYNTKPFTDRWSTKSNRHSYVFDLPGDWILKLGKAREKLRKAKAKKNNFEESNKDEKQKWKKHRDWMNKIHDNIRDNYKKFSSEWKSKFKILKKKLRYNYRKFLSSDWKSYVKNLFPQWNF